MPTAFTPAADFSGMDGSRDLSIGRVIHQAFIEVNEEGTEAAAATAVVTRLTSAPMKEIEFRADHPFMFVIQENGAGTVLFVGRVSDPTA
jgi:serpin B